MLNVQQLFDELNKNFNGKLQISEDGQAVYADKSNIKDLLSVLKEKYGYRMLIDITASDYQEFFEVIYHVMSVENADMVRIKLKTARNELKVPSATKLWKNADVLEREIYDLMGITFEGHGSLKRILCSEDFQGHPLRKEFKLNIIDRFEN